MSAWKRRIAHEKDGPPCILEFYQYTPKFQKILCRLIVSRICGIRDYEHEDTAIKDAIEQIKSGNC